MSEIICIEGCSKAPVKESIDAGLKKLKNKYQIRMNKKLVM